MGDNGRVSARGGDAEAWADKGMTKRRVGA